MNMTSKEAFKEYKEIYVDKKFKGECHPSESWYLEIIEKDLETFEIIDNKEVDIGLVKYLINKYADNLYILEEYNKNFSMPYRLEMEELLILKSKYKENRDE